MVINGPSMKMQRDLLEQMKDEGHAGQVARACVRGLEQDPDDIPLRRLLADCYKELGFLSLAESEKSIVVEKIEGFISVYKDQARSFSEQGRTEEAFALLEKYLAHRPGDEEAAELFNGLTKVEEEPPSEVVPETHVTSPPSSEPDEIFPEMATHTLAEIYVAQGQHEAAMETYRQLLAQNPEDQKASTRLQELETGMVMEQMTPEPLSVEKDGRERMINVLEGWLAGIQQRNRASGDPARN